MTEEQQDIEISNPVFGRLAAKGIRVSDMIGLLTLIGVLGIGFLGWMTFDAVGKQGVEASKMSSNIAVSIKQSASAQRLMTCIISIPQERREQEFMQSNSFCSRMSNLP